MKAAVRRAASSICSGLRRQWVLGLQRATRLDATIKGMLWMALSGLLLVLLNVICRYLAQQLHPLQAQFLRYFGAVLVMLPSMPVKASAALSRLAPSKLAAANSASKVKLCPTRTDDSRALLR